MDAGTQGLAPLTEKPFGWVKHIHVHVSSLSNIWLPIYQCKHIPNTRRTPQSLIKKKKLSELLHSSDQQRKGLITVIEQNISHNYTKFCQRQND